MIPFSLAAGLMFAAVMIFLVWPFWHRSRTPLMVEDETHLVRELERDKERLLRALAELETERDRGRLAPTDYQRFTAMDQHRLAQVLAQLDRLTLEDAPGAGTRGRDLPQSPQPARPLQWVAPLLLSLVVAGGASGIYASLHANPQGRAPTSETVQPGRPPINPLEMVARLERRLRENPDDLEGQVMAGRSYMTLQRWEDAEQAWQKVLTLNNRNHEAYTNLGVIRLQEATPGDTRTYEEALAHFEKALINVPRDPSVLWVQGIALAHLTRYSEADESWTTAYQNLPAGSEEKAMVRQALEDLRAGTGRTQAF